MSLSSGSSKNPVNSSTNGFNSIPLPASVWNPQHGNGITVNEISTSAVPTSDEITKNLLTLLSLVGFNRASCFLMLEVMKRIVTGNISSSNNGFPICMPSILHQNNSSALSLWKRSENSAALKPNGQLNAMQTFSGEFDMPVGVQCRADKWRTINFKAGFSQCRSSTC
uniref:Uncharacterized protein n=1 Tax=Caenorhabditis tropicalis TaxID=1561998 RepID=A0A1I7U142_9PELO